MLLFVGYAGSAASGVGAQSLDAASDSYVSELSGFEIEVIDDEFEIVRTALQEYEHGEGEVVQVSSTTAQIQISFFDDTDTNLETLELYSDAFSGDVDDFEVLDQGEDGDTVYLFAVATYQEASFLYYLSVTEDVTDNVDMLQQIYAPDTTFIDDLKVAQDSILIDGDGFLEDVDADDLASLADLPTGMQDDPEETQEATVEDDPGEEPDSGTRGSLDGETHKFELSEAELVLSDDVSVTNVLLQEPVVEQVQLQLSDSEAVGSGMDALENLGTDADRSSAWSLDVGTVNGEETVIYIRVDQSRYEDVHYIEMMIGPEETFMEDLQAFGDGVEIDGVPMYADADVDLLEPLLEGGGQPDDTDTGNESDRDRNDPKGGSGEDEDVSTDDLDLESQGLISDTEFESLQYGFVVEWDDAVWAIDPEWEFSAVSDPESGVDSVILFWQEGGASMLIQILPSDGGEPADYLDLWESDDFIADSVHEDAEVLRSDSSRSSAGIAYLTYDSEGREVILIQEVVELDGGDTVAIVTMFGSPVDVADAYADAEDLVTVGDEDAVGTFTPREIENAVAP
jgi:hypothetical protein